MRTFVSLCCGGYAQSGGKVLRIYCLNVSHVYARNPIGLCVCTMKRGAPVANSRIKLAHKQRGVTLLVVRVCVYMCENVHSFVYSFVISIFSTRYAFIGVVCCRINQLNYLWWWINRFVFR